MPVGLRLAAVCCTAWADTDACAPPSGGAKLGGGGCGAAGNCKDQSTRVVSPATKRGGKPGCLPSDSRYSPLL